MLARSFRNGARIRAVALRITVVACLALMAKAARVAADPAAAAEPRVKPVTEEPQVLLAFDHETPRAQRSSNKLARDASTETVET